MLTRLPRFTEASAAFLFWEHAQRREVCNTINQDRLWDSPHRPAWSSSSATSYWRLRCLWWRGRRRCWWRRWLGRLLLWCRPHKRTRPLHRSPSLLLSSVDLNKMQENVKETERKELHPVRIRSICGAAGFLTSSLAFHLRSNLGNLRTTVGLVCNCSLPFVFQILFHQILNGKKGRNTVLALSR